MRRIHNYSKEMYIVYTCIKKVLFEPCVLRKIFSYCQVLSNHASQAKKYAFILTLSIF
jgi:hypothetical protein